MNGRAVGQQLLQLFLGDCARREKEEMESTGKVSESQKGPNPSDSGKILEGSPPRIRSFSLWCMHAGSTHNARALTFELIV